MKRLPFADVFTARIAGLPPEALTYGEIPVAVAVCLLARAGVGPGARVVDLGCGRGNVLLAARRLGATAAVGVEVLSSRAQVAAPDLNAVGIEILVGDARAFPLTGATHIVCTWTCFDASSRAELAARLETSAPGAHIVVLTWPIDVPGFWLLARLRVPCSWGLADALIYEWRGSPDEAACRE